MIDDSSFDVLDAVSMDRTIAVDVCVDCNVRMVMAIDHFECDLCGRCDRIIGNRVDCTEDATSGVVSTTQSGRVYIVNNNSLKARNKEIETQLSKRAEDFKGLPFPKCALSSVAHYFIEIQKLCSTFVRRGDIRNQFLAVLLRYECMKIGHTRSDSDCMHFMKCNNGLSRGYSIFLDLHQSGVLNAFNLPVNIEVMDGHLARYLGSIDTHLAEIGEMPINTPENVKFICHLVEQSYLMNIPAKSVKSTRIVGAIFVLIYALGRTVSKVKLTEICDNIQFATWMKVYYAIVEEYLGKFLSVFIAHDIGIADGKLFGWLNLQQCVKRGDLPESAKCRSIGSLF